MQLFVEELSDDQLDDGDVLNIHHEFDGPTGQKLLALQSRVGHDPRFRLDGRFRDEDSGSFVGAESEDDEKQRTLGVLSSIIPDVSMSQRKDARMFRDMTVRRYDPTSEDHKNFEVCKTKKTKQKDKRLSKETSSPSTDLPEVAKTKYFEYIDDFKGTFIHSEEPFSLFGDAPVTHTEQKRVKFSAEPLAKEKVQKSFKASVKIPTSASSPAAKPTVFFLDSSDEKVQASVDFFCQHYKLKDIRKDWQDKRYDLIQLYRQRHRDAIRRLKSKKSSGFAKRTFKKQTYFEQKCF